MMKTKKSSEKCSCSNEVWFIAGSIAVFTVAFVAIPKIMPSIAGFVNKHCTKFANARKSEDDWGPVLIRKDID